MAKFAQGKFTPKNPEKYLGNKFPTYRSGCHKKLKRHK